MTGRSLLKRFTRSGWMAFALFALVTRAFIPAGFMVAHDPETGRGQIVLCGGVSGPAPFQMRALEPLVDSHAGAHAGHAAHENALVHAGHAHGDAHAPEGDHSEDHASACPGSMAAGVAIVAPPTEPAGLAVTGRPLDSAPTARAEIRAFGFRAHAPPTGPPYALA